MVSSVDVANLDPAVLRTAEPSFNHAQSRDEFRNFERLWQVVIGTAVEPGDACIDTRSGGQNQNRNRRPGAANLLQDIEPVHVGQAKIEHYHVRRLDTYGMQRRPAFSDMIRDKALATEGLAQSGGQRLVVLDEKYLHTACSCPRVVGAPSL